MHVVVGGWVGVHGGAGESGYGMEQAVFGVDGVCLEHRQRRVDEDVGLGVQLVADPPRPQRADAA